MENNELIGKVFTEEFIDNLPEEELKHWGIKGMKWGVRKYQNKDGTLTPRGKKRYAKELKKLREEREVLKNKAKTQAKIDKLETMRKENEEMAKSLRSPSKGKSSTSDSKKKADSKPRTRLEDMSDEELQRIVNRLTYEKRYRELNPEQKSKGRKFVEGLFEKAVVPAAQEVAKTVVRGALADAVKKTTKGKIDPDKKDKKDKS